MGLSDIAEGIEVTTEQRDPGVAKSDRTDRSLTERLTPFAEELPCSAEEATLIVEAYTEGASLSRAAAVAELPKTTAAKTLYLLGEPIDPLTPTARRVMNDWLAGSISRTEAKTLANVGETEFALGAYTVTHDPIPAAETAVADALALEDTSDPLSDARSSIDDWL
jgi:hypothetical protein